MYNCEYFEAPGSKPPTYAKVCLCVCVCVCVCVRARVYLFIYMSLKTYSIILINDIVISNFGNIYQILHIG
jgi:hypothetical protein